MLFIITVRNCLQHFMDVGWFPVLSLKAIAPSWCMNAESLSGNKWEKQNIVMSVSVCPPSVHTYLRNCRAILYSIFCACSTVAMAQSSSGGVVITRYALLVLTLCFPIMGTVWWCDKRAALTATASCTCSAVTQHSLTLKLRPSLLCMASS